MLTSFQTLSLTPFLNLDPVLNLSVLWTGCANDWRLMAGFMKVSSQEETGALCLTASGAAIAAGVCMYKAIEYHNLYEKCCYGKSHSSECRDYSRKDWCDNIKGDSASYWRDFWISFGVSTLSCVVMGATLCAKRLSNPRSGYSSVCYVLHPVCKSMWPYIFVESRECKTSTSRIMA